MAISPITETPPPIPHPITKLSKSAFLSASDEYLEANDIPPIRTYFITLLTTEFGGSSQEYLESPLHWLVMKEKISLVTARNIFNLISETYPKFSTKDRAWSSIQNEIRLAGQREMTEDQTKTLDENHLALGLLNDINEWLFPTPSLEEKELEDDFSTHALVEYINNEGFVVAACNYFNDSPTQSELYSKEAEKIFSQFPKEVIDAFIIDEFINETTSFERILLRHQVIVFVRNAQLPPDFATTLDKTVLAFLCNQAHICAKIKIAISLGLNKHARSLIKSIFPPNFPSNKKEVFSPLLFFAAEKRNQEMIEFLVGEGVALNVQNRYKCSLLDHAILTPGNSKVAMYLSRAGCPIRPDILYSALTSRKESSLLFLLKEIPQEAQMLFQHKIAANHPEISNHTRFLQSFLDVEIPFHLDPAGNSLLHCAAKNSSNMELFQWILQREIQINLSNNEGMTALHLAAPIHKNTQMMQALLSAGADINAKTHSGLTPLTIALQSIDNEENVLFLLRNGATLQEDELHKAVGIFNNERNVECLLDAGANINLPNSEKRTPLHVAVMKYEQYADNANNKHVIKLLMGMAKTLLDRGANLFLQDDQNKTPLDYTREYGFFEFMDVVEPHIRLNIWRKQLEAFLSYSPHADSHNTFKEYTDLSLEHLIDFSKTSTETQTQISSLAKLELQQLFIQAADSSNQFVKEQAIEILQTLCKGEQVDIMHLLHCPKRSYNFGQSLFDLPKRLHKKLHKKYLSVLLLCAANEKNRKELFSLISYQSKDDPHYGLGLLQLNEDDLLREYLKLLVLLSGKEGVPVEKIRNLLQEKGSLLGERNNPLGKFMLGPYKLKTQSFCEGITQYPDLRNLTCLFNEESSQALETKRKEIEKEQLSAKTPPQEEPLQPLLSQETIFLLNDFFKGNREAIAKTLGPPFFADFCHLFNVSTPQALEAKRLTFELLAQPTATPEEVLPITEAIQANCQGGRWDIIQGFARKEEEHQRKQLSKAAQQQLSMDYPLSAKEEKAIQPLPFIELLAGGIRGCQAVHAIEEQTRRIKQAKHQEQADYIAVRQQPRKSNTSKEPMLQAAFSVLTSVSSLLSQASSAKSQAVESSILPKDSEKVDTPLPETQKSKETPSCSTTIMPSTNEKKESVSIFDRLKNLPPVPTHDPKDDKSERSSKDDELERRCNALRDVTEESPKTGLPPLLNR